MSPDEFAHLLDCLRQSEAATDDDEAPYAVNLLRQALFPSTQAGIQRALLVYSDAIERGDLVEAGRRAVDVRRIIAAAFEPLGQTRH